MDTTEYRKWGDRLLEEPTGSWRRKVLLIVLGLSVIAVLWVLILSVLLFKASTERGELQGQQDRLGTDALKLTAVLGDLKKEMTAYNSNIQGVQAQLQTTSKELKEAQAKLLEQESGLKDLSERVTQGLAKAGRELEDVRTELIRALASVRVGNVSCTQCPESWMSFQGSCYFFSEQRARWEDSQSLCAKVGAHLVIVTDLEEQTFLTRNTRGLGYWLGLKAVRHLGKVQRYQWVDGVPLSFSYWNKGEPNDSHGTEDCVMMLNSGLWNDAPCDNERDNWVCEKRQSC